jgi:hypothetical protein
MGEIGQKFVFEQVTDITIDDDKLRHQSTSFGVKDYNSVVSEGAGAGQ